MLNQKNENKHQLFLYTYQKKIKVWNNNGSDKIFKLFKLF